MATVTEQVQQIYIGLLGRAADAEGLAFWVDQIENEGGSIEAVRASFTDPSIPEWTDGLGAATRPQLVNALYNNLFGRDAESEGLEYWVNGGGASVNADQLVLALIDGASAADQLVVDNRVEAAVYYTEQVGADSEAAVTAVGNVDSTAASVAESKAATDAIGDSSGQTFTLTQRADDLNGTGGDDVFAAPVTQADTGFGALANTFETGDVLSGGQGIDSLRAALIDTGTIGDQAQGAAIAAETTGIENVFFTSQTPQGDVSNNTTAGSTVDAGSMEGVQQWWTDESRSTVQIEDIRTRPQETAFGMKLTDGLVGYNAFFNPLFLDGDLSAESALTLIVQEITDGQSPSVTELENISVREINFTLGDTDYTLDTADIRAADTWAELEAGIAAELAEQGLDSLTVSHNGNGVFEVNDSEGGVFAAEDGEALILGVASDIDTRNRASVGRLEEEGQVSTNLILDGAGSGSRGGVVNIASMSGDRGVEVMDVQVGRDSHITTLQSVNDPSNTQSFSAEQMLEEVFVSHADGAAGTLQLGARTVDAQGVSTTTDDRLQTGGLQDVRVFDASGFDAALKVGASLTANAFDKYLAGAEDAVQFSYLLGDGGSNLNLAVNNTLAGDVDFELEVVGGAGDDRINLSGLAVKQQTSVDGDLGENTLEVNTSTGFAATQAGADIVAPAPTDLTAAQTSFDSVDNIDTVVVAGGANTTHDVVAAGFSDVDSFVIATTGGVNTRLVRLDATEQTVDVSGKNQTLGTGNSDANQTFGTVRFSNTSGSDLDIGLDNTARVSGTMTTAALTVDGNASDVRTLALQSNGARQTSNVVTTLNGNLVNTFDLEGTQDLTITNLASAANSTAASAASRDSLEVNAEMLEGDLYLGVTGAVITNVDAALGTNRSVELVGTEGDSDILNIRDGVTTTNATTISDFETVRFGQAAQIVNATSFNATNVSGVELYDLVDSTATINLSNLRSTETVQINVDNTNGTSVDADVTLAAANPTAGSQVSVDFSANTTGGGVDLSYWGAGGANLNVQDFSTISLDMGGVVGDSYDYNFNLNTLANATSGNVNARTLEITGGQVDASLANLDSLTLGELDTALTTVDFSGYTGNFVTSGWNSTTGSNADVIVNAYSMVYDVGGDNTLFNVGSAGFANTAEQQTVDFAAAFGDLADGATITLTFAGGEYTFTNDTGATIANAAIVDAIAADAANAPSQFTITQSGGAGTPVELNAARFGDMPVVTPVVTSTDVANSPGNMTITDDVIQGDSLGGLTSQFVTVESEFLTKFVFTDDVEAQGLVWQIDNFQAFDGVGNVSLNTQSQLDLRQLGVDSSTKITIEAGDTFWGGLTAAEQGNYSAADAATINSAANTVISSNDGLDFTIVLTGVASTDLGNENIVGVA